MAESRLHPRTPVVWGRNFLKKGERDRHEYDDRILLREENAAQRRNWGNEPWSKELGKRAAGKFLRAAMEPAVDIALVDIALIAAINAMLAFVLFAFVRLWLSIQSQDASEREHLEQTEELAEAVLARMHREVDAALAEQRAAHQGEMDATRRAIAAEYGELAAQMSREVDAALAAHRAALQQELDTMEGSQSLTETVAHMREEVRTLEKGLREMGRGLRAPDERALRPGGEQRLTDYLGPFVVARRSRRSADATDVPALPTDSCTSGASKVDCRALASRRPAANKHLVAPAEAAAQRIIRHADPRHAAQAGRPAAPGPCAGISLDPRVRVDPTPTLVSGISCGRAARTRQEAQESQSTPPALRQNIPPTAGAQVGCFYEEAGSAAEQHSGSDPALRALARASFSRSAPVLPVAVAAGAARARGQRAQEPQKRYPPLSALLSGMEHTRRAAPPTQGRQTLSCGGLFYAEVIRRHVRQEARAKARDRGEEAAAAAAAEA